MFASIRRYKMEPSLVDELVRRVEEGFVPIISKAQGFISYYAVDAGNGMFASVSVFEDQNGAEQSNKMAANYVKDNLSSILTNPPDITAGEVRVYKK